MSSGDAETFTVIDLRRSPRWTMKAVSGAPTRNAAWSFRGGCRLRLPDAGAESPGTAGHENPDQNLPQHQGGRREIDDRPVRHRAGVGAPFDGAIRHARGGEVRAPAEPSNLVAAVVLRFASARGSVSPEARRRDAADAGFGALLARRPRKTGRAFGGHGGDQDAADRHSAEPEHEDRVSHDGLHCIIKPDAAPEVELGSLRK